MRGQGAWFPKHGRETKDGLRREADKGREKVGSEANKISRIDRQKESQPTS
jgi:hypothetical protein